MTDTEEEVESFEEDDDRETDEDYELSPPRKVQRKVHKTYYVEKVTKKRRVESVDTQGTSSQRTIDDELPSDEDIDTQETNSPEVELKDGNYFLQLLNEEKSRILKNAADLEKEFEALQADSSVTLSEEVVGVVRAVIEKSRCLVNLKFKIFEELCNVPATASGDLQGFWDMMLFLVDNINRSFNEIQKCRENGWKKPEVQIPQPPKRIPNRKRPLKRHTKPLENKRKQKVDTQNGADENSCLNGDSEAVGDAPVNGDVKQQNGSVEVVL